MTAPTLYPSATQFITIKAERISGVAESGFDYIIGCKTGGINALDTNKVIKDDTIIGDMNVVHAIVPGILDGEVSLQGPAKLDTLPYFVSAALGSYKVSSTGSIPAYNHYLANRSTLGTPSQPPTFTITVYLSGGQARQFAGAILSDFSFSWTPDGAPEFNAKFTSLASVGVSIPTPSYTAEAQLAGWSLTANMQNSAGGTSETLYTSSGDITFKRSVTPVHTNNGSRNAVTIFAGALDVSAKITALATNDTTELTAFANTTSRYFSLTAAAASPVAGAGTETVLIEALSAKWETLETKSGKEYMELDGTLAIEAKPVTISGFPSTGNSPVQVTVANNVIGSVYFPIGAVFTPAGGSASTSLPSFTHAVAAPTIAVTEAGGLGSATITVTGLPAGLSYSAGNITGTPTTASTGNATVSVSDSVTGQSVTLTVPWTVA